MSLGRVLNVNSNKPRLQSLEGLRAYAAFIVYFLHLTGSFFYDRIGLDFDKISVVELSNIQPEFIPFYWIWSSHYGVDIFFLISGFLIAKLVNIENFEFGKFIYHRVLRIYPALILSTLAYITYGIVVKDEQFWFGGLVGNLLLLNGIPGLGFPHINQVTWSIFFEFSFYIIFPVLWKLSCKRFNIFLLISFSIIFPLLFISSTYMRYLMFSAGVLLSVSSQEKLSFIRSNLKDSYVVFLYILSTIMFMFIKNFALFIPFYFFTSFLFVDRVLNSAGKLQKFFSNNILRYFGNISFSFYLFHPLGLAFAKDLLLVFNVKNDYAYFVYYLAISFTLTSIISTACFVLIEKRYFNHKQFFDSIYENFSDFFAKKCVKRFIR